MITKLTLTIDDGVITSAKKYALKNGKSLSALVENYLKTISSPEEGVVLSPKITKMMGVIKLPDDFDHKKGTGRYPDSKIQVMYETCFYRYKCVD